MKNKSQTIAVLMSVYNNDDVKGLDAAIESIKCQTYKDIDIYIYCDGIVEPELLRILKDNETNGHAMVYYSTNNNGLAYALNFLINIIKNINYGFIARMDADDISAPERFSEQVNFLNNNPHISVLGTNCLEINETGDVIFEKKMPEQHHQIERFIIKRSPLIHPTVMFRGGIIEKLNYDTKLMNTQDYYLWVDLLADGVRFHNLQQNLLYFRVSNSFYKRRGVRKIINEVSGRFYAMRKLKQLNIKNIFYVAILICIRLSPELIKKFCYRKLR